MVGKGRLHQPVFAIDAGYGHRSLEKVRNTSTLPTRLFAQIRPNTLECIVYQRQTLLNEIGAHVEDPGLFAAG